MFCPACRSHFADGFRHCPSDGTALRRSARATREFVVDPFVGKTLDGRYRIEHRIGEGRVGVVYAARHVSLDKLVAVKILRREMSGDAAAVRRFSQEARAASQVGHPAIADVTDFGQTQDQAYLVMEHLEGETLEQRMRDRGPMAPSEAVALARQVARGLHAAHGKGIVHRDLKPANVFLQQVDDAPCRVKLLDFGLSKISQQRRATLVGTFLGTPEYVAPEQAAGLEVDARADVYALGVIVYEMLAGRVPFHAATPSRTLMMHLDSPVPALAAARPGLDVPADLEAVVMGMLGKAREERFSSMGAVDAALAAVERRMAPPVEVRAPGPPPAGAMPLAAPLRTAVAGAALPPSAAVAHPRQSLAAPPRRWPVTTGVVAAAVLGGLAGAWLARADTGATLTVQPVTPSFVPAPAIAPRRSPPASTASMAPPPAPVAAQEPVDPETRAPAPPSGLRPRSRRSSRSARANGAESAREPPAAEPPPGLLPFPGDRRR